MSGFKSRATLVLVFGACMALLAVACVLSPDAAPTPLPSAVSTPAPAPLPSAVSTPVPTVVPLTLPPTWTLPPAPSPSPLPTGLPPWPTAEPTPTTAPPLRPGMQAAAYFFYWHDCPAGNCKPEIIYAVPPGWTAPYPGDTDSRDGVYYSSLNRYWYLQELRDMQLAGIDVVLPVSWGDSPYPWFRTAVLANLVEANRMVDPPLRIGLFDDTTSEVSEYGDYADNGLFDGSTYTTRGIPLDLTDPTAGFLFYDRKIRPFFQTIPQEMWATHDGRPVEAGGRPLLVVYTRAGIVHLERAGELWAAVKASFARDFHDRNGQPITPFVILEDSWFNQDSLGGSPPLDTVADGRYTWGTALLGPQEHTFAGYTVSSIGAGFDDRKNENSTNRLQRRDLTPDGQPGGPGAFLEGSFDRIPTGTNLLLLETWNELYEGTNVSRAAYPEIAGQFVPEDYYIGLLRRLLRGQDLWWGAQPLLPSWPAHLERGRSYRLDFPVENTGTRTWSAEEGVYLSVTGDLVPTGYQAWPEAPVRPGEVARFNVPLTAPAQDGSYRVVWQMVGPAGPIGPQVEWTLPVEMGAVTTTLRVVQPTAPLLVGRPATLAVELAPAAQVAAVRLHLRFDPALLTLEGVQPLVGRPREWNVKVDNDRGEADLEVLVGAPELLGQLVQLRLRGRAVGQSGFWIEQASIRLQDGTLLMPPALWVPLEVAAAP